MKKIFKILGALSMIVLFSMSLTSCSDDVKDPKHHDKDLVGSWNTREDWGSGDYADITWTFKSNGKFEVKEIIREDGEKDTYKASGTWETDDDEYLYLEIKVDGDSDYAEYEYEVEGKKLYIYDNYGSYAVFKKK
ncbi:MAG: hypothetical protein K2M87_06580 [Muribaculaceae bacterium]|nr:hypothetical protein [Muribaculaceae bacterium]